LQYMTTADAGAVWAGTGAIISPIKSVPATAYPNDLAKREAAQVANASAVRFDGSDLLPSGGGDDMGAALQDALRGKTVDWAGFENYVRLFTDPDFINLSTFPRSGALWNNVLWIVFYTSIVIFLGLIIAVVAARVRYESVIKAIVFIPMAISATALAVIWKFVYSPDANIGLLIAVLGNFGLSSVALLCDEHIVIFALIAVGIWGSVGFATVILSAAVKSIP